MVTVDQKEMMIIDSHTHLPSSGWSGHTSFLPSVARAVEYLRESGTDGALFNMWQGVFSKTEADVNEANETALRLFDEYRGFLYPGAILHPDYPEASLHWLEKFRSRGLMWVGELVFHNHSHRYIDAPFMRLMEECAKYGHVVQLHCHTDVIELAKKFPETQFVISHLLEEEVLQNIAKQPNIWQDISGMQGGLVIGQLERAVKIIGPDRLLYGSDFDGYEPRAFMTRVRTVVTDNQSRKKIFSENLLRLLNYVKSVPLC